jgi:mannose-6-phosphate isomerase
VKVSLARLEPIFSLRPWGARSLAPLFPERTHLNEPIGEAWMTGLDCRFVNGPFAGRKLGDAWQKMDVSWRGKSVDRKNKFPLLVKFLFTEEKLSVQVHPDDEYAGRFEAQAGGRGKTEMWYALQARPGAEVLLGLRPEVTSEQLNRAIRDGTAEKLLDSVPLRAGEAVFVPARTAHTIGAGLTLCEIQEYSDLTYRVYDYNRRDAKGRSRELHIEKALEVVRFGKQNSAKLAPLTISHNGVEETYFIACRYFATEKWDFAGRITRTSSSEHFDLLIFLAGSGQIELGSERMTYGPAQVWMVPASLGEYALAPDHPTALLRTYVPSNVNEFVHQLETQGIDHAAAVRLVHA